MEEPSDLFSLLTQLCDNVASQYSYPPGVSKKKIIDKMRICGYELILRHKVLVQPKFKEPASIADLCVHYYQVTSKGAQNIMEYKRLAKLKDIIEELKEAEFENKTEVFNFIRLLIALSNSVKDNVAELHKEPFSFGWLDRMLPNLNPEPGSTDFYPFYPSTVFKLPYASILEANKQETQLGHPHTVLSQQSISNQRCISSIQSPVSLISIISLSSCSSMYENFDFPRPKVGCEIRIPSSDSREKQGAKVSLPSEVQQITKERKRSSLQLWELASNTYQVLPHDIWETEAKMPPTKSRPKVSRRDIHYWRQKYTRDIRSLNIVPEEKFVRHLIHLTIGVATSSFCRGKQMRPREKLAVEGISVDCLERALKDTCIAGTIYGSLFDFEFDNRHTGLIFEAAKRSLVRYLLDYRLRVTTFTEVGDSDNTLGHDRTYLPSIMQVMYQSEKLHHELMSVAHLFRPYFSDIDKHGTMQTGGDFVTSVFEVLCHNCTDVSEMKAISRIFIAVCKVYFKFIERFIFSGEIQDPYLEFFIDKNDEYVRSRSKRFWDNGFYISPTHSIPKFLKDMSKCILLCGKSLRLFKMCRPVDPLVLLISSDHPSVKCCTSFEQLEQQQQLLDVYRTRCRFVSGERPTFEEILLKRDAQRKAFAEIASIKQTETLKKIVAERKRLAQLIIAEKQHSLKVLEAAIQESKNAKNRSKKYERNLAAMEKKADNTREEVDSKIIDQEKKNIMDYYSRLNKEVEKSQIHTEWKLKRLQLDQSRVLLLSTEERNLKREKLELEHRLSEEAMKMSIQSDKFFDTDDTEGTNDQAASTNSPTNSITEHENSTILVTPTEFEVNRNKSRHSTIGTSDAELCDNTKETDDQGNIIPREINSNMTTSSSEIGYSLETRNLQGNLQFLENRRDAYLNKQKVMAHEFGTDYTTSPVTSPVTELLRDKENNLPMTTHDEALRNRAKVLGTEYHLPVEHVVQTQPRTAAQKEAVMNRQKVLGAVYNLPAEIVNRKEPANVAQIEAAQNKVKDLDTEEVLSVRSMGMGVRKGLKLELMPSASMTNVGDIDSPGSITLAQFPRLDIETPTTAEALHFENDTELFADERSRKDNESKSEKDYSTYDFSILDDDDIESQDPPLIESPTRPMILPINKNYAYSKLQGNYSLECFDPFELNNMTPFSPSTLSDRKLSPTTESHYSNPANIMEEMSKKPYESLLRSDSNDDDDNCGTANLATLIACLQRSVMLPLTCQLEVVNSAILNLYLVELDMYDHLRSLKDYFFLMDGEFSSSICHNLFTKLKATINPQELLNYSTLHYILDKAVECSVTKTHKCSESLTIVVSDIPLSFQHSSPDVLQCMTLNYTVEWPLNIIMSEEALQRYGRVFQFLLKMRRVAWVLKEDFEYLKYAVKFNRIDGRRLQKSPKYIAVQSYRHIMASMIRSLDNYIVNTCILASCNDFENDLKKAKTLDDLYECHVVYVKKVLFRCLLNNRSTPVSKLLNDIFTVILKFSRVLQAGDWQATDDAGHLTHQNFNQLEELFHLFKKLGTYLHKVISRLTDCGYQRHLIELLTIINWNGYYDLNKEAKNVSSNETNFLSPNE